MEDEMENHVHIRDGVYAKFDGYGIELRANDPNKDDYIYLEPDVLEALIRFAQQWEMLKTETK
jgi:hypothetical protein